MTVAELTERMSERELQEWQLLEQLEPFGEVKEDYRAASICLTLYNVNRTKDSKELSVEDFMVKFERSDQESDDEDTPDNAFMALAEMLGATVKRDDG